MTCSRIFITYSYTAGKARTAPPGAAIKTAIFAAPPVTVNNRRSLRLRVCETISRVCWCREHLLGGGVIFPDGGRITAPTHFGAGDKHTLDFRFDPGKMQDIVIHLLEQGFEFLFCPAQHLAAAAWQNPKDTPSGVVPLSAAESEAASRERSSPSGPVSGTVVSHRKRDRRQAAVCCFACSRCTSPSSWEGISSRAVLMRSILASCSARELLEACSFCGKGYAVDRRGRFSG